MKKKTMSIFFITGITILVFPLFGLCADDTAELKKQVEALTKRVAELEAQVARPPQPLLPSGMPGPSGDFASEMKRMQEQMNRLMQASSGLGGANVVMMNNFDLTLDRKDTPTHYVFTVALPGATKENIKVNVHDRMMTVSGERSASSEQTQGQQIRRAQSFGSFSKTVSLPPDADENNVTTDYANDVLTIKVARQGANPSVQPSGK